MPDHWTNTEADAGAYERAHAEPDDDGPTDWEVHGVPWPADQPDRLTTEPDDCDHVWTKTWSHTYVSCRFCGAVEYLEEDA